MRKIILLIASLTAFIFCANGQVQVVKYETTGTHTFTVPDFVNEITVECWGAGGGGGYSPDGNTPTPGGGGSAYAKSVISNAGGTEFTIEVGAGGSGENVDAEQKAGGASSLSISSAVLVKAVGGGGASNSTLTGAGAGGKVTDCIYNEIAHSGGDGANATSTSSWFKTHTFGGGGGGAGSSTSGGNASGATAGTGGSEGGGNGGAGNTSAYPGNPGSTYGGGGSGARGSNSGTKYVYGGVGADGAVVITYVIPLNYALKIFNNHSLTIMPKTYVTIDADITNDGLLYIKSNEDGDGSLITLREVSGNNNFKVERYLSPDKWHFMSSPVTYATSAMFKGSYLREFSETENVWGPYIKETDVEFLPGKGFSVWKEENDITAIYKGLINNTDITIPLTNNNANSTSTGWNLIGNPFTSAIDLDSQLGWSKTNVGNAVYTFDGVKQKYIYFLTSLGTDNPEYANPPIGTGDAADQYIAMGQGFFVHAVDNNASITIKKNAQTHNTIKFKNEQHIPNLIRVKVDGNNRSDESILYIAQNSLETYDYQRDAIKLFDNYPQLYSQKQDTKLAISAYDDIEKINGKLLYLEVGETENYTISFTHSIENMNLYLKDLFTNKYIEANEVYKFTAKPEDRNIRFEFVVKQATDIKDEDIVLNENMSVWEYDNILFVNTRINEEIKSINIYNALGKLVLSSDSNQTNLNSLPFGVYIVKISTNMENKTTKVLIK